MVGENNSSSIAALTQIRVLCLRLYEYPKDVESMRQLQNSINNSSNTTVRCVESIIFSAFFPILKSISESSNSFKEEEKQQVIDTFNALFKKIVIEKLPLFFNIYGFLLFEIYDHKTHTVKSSSEEYKLSIVECVISLIRCLSYSAIEALYTKENVPKLCQMVYAVLEIAENEQFKTLRISSINCMMAMARVLDDHDFSDLVLRNQVAQVFFFFLPGTVLKLKSIALVDEKIGHKVPSVALQAWGRIVTLLMQDYSAKDNQISGSDEPVNIEWKEEQAVRDYINKAGRTPAWYKSTDKKLQQVIAEFSKLTHHSHFQVRLQLANAASLIIDNCIETMPTSISYLIEYIIILSQDDDAAIAHKSKLILENLSIQLGDKGFKSLMEAIEEGFYVTVSSLPRKFNQIDERVQIVTLNSLIGYISLFGKHNLLHVLHSSVHLHKLLLSLLHISQFDKTGMNLFEQNAPLDYSKQCNTNTSWKRFRYFKDESVCEKIETVCQLLAKFGASWIISDFLLDTISLNSDQKTEAIFILNGLVRGIEAHGDNFTIIKNILQTYIDYSNWYLPLCVTVDEQGFEHTLGDVQSNIVQVCLLVEGIGKIAQNIGESFKQFMLKTLYLVLERAGNSNVNIRLTGIKTLSDIAAGCGYSDITSLINANIDYFSFHIDRKLHRGTESEGALNVLAVLIRYSNKDVLSSTCEIIRELLIHTYDKRKVYLLNSYLRVFKMFIHGLHKWLDIKIQDDEFKTKKQKQEELEDFQVSDIEPIDSSHEVMDKTAEEMYKEDMMKNKEQLEQEIYNDTEYKKPEPPTYIKLTVAVLSRSLHCLPSKDQSRKLVTLDILTQGLVVLKEWEDELLPIVHQIWSPLVDRFKETNDPLMINYCFQLLIVLAKLSKDFIRMRTSKEVLPSILDILEKLKAESYLQDKGAAYRYSQNYKLQENLLRKLAHLITDLDMLESDFEKCMNTVAKYLSDKQPLPLQQAAIQFFATLNQYDPITTMDKVEVLRKENIDTEFTKNLERLQKSTT